MMEQILNDFYSNADDDFCLEEAKKMEADDLRHNSMNRISSRIDCQGPSVDSNVTVYDSIEKTYRCKTLARPYLQEYFFSFESWPTYILELFIKNNIAEYSYVTRNKICLFFYGNGASLEIMQTLSEFFAPCIKECQIRAFDESLRKCRGLFNTYIKERYNPAYTQRYYYYNMIENRMLFLDGTPRHYGQRKE